MIMLSQPLFSVLGMSTTCHWLDTFNRSNSTFIVTWLAFLCLWNRVTVKKQWMPLLYPKFAIFTSIFLTPASPLQDYTDLILSHNSSHTQTHVCMCRQIHILFVISLLLSDWDRRFVASGLLSVCIGYLSCLALVICGFPDTSRVDLPSILFCLEESIWCPALVRR